MKKRAIENKKELWYILSDLYLDTELDDSDFKRIALNIYNIGFTFIESKKIDKYEVFPVLMYNLLSVAGIWEGFEKESLSKAIMKNLKNRSFITKFFLEVSYFFFKEMNKEYWNKIEKEFLNLNKQL